MNKFQPTIESITTHEVPEWYQGAKLGIFVHYGLYSVPGWAVVNEGGITQTLKKMGWSGHLRVNPYAEWYLNTMRIKDSPTQIYHQNTYGSNFSYSDFAAHFNEENAKWDPDTWAALFARIGARYVILTSKHCESFQLWPSKHPNPYMKDYQSKRDIVGELSSAVRSHGMRMGLYYCGGFDWTFNTSPITKAVDLGLSIPQSQDYIDYCTNHWHELIDRYQPSIMWGDVGYPQEADVPALFAHYYNNVPDGVINDRFYQVDPGPIKKLIRIPGMRSLIDRILTKAFLEGKTSTPTVHSDFTTPEYSSNQSLTTKKWETCRGLGYSFGYNRNETADHMLSVKELVHLFVDIVSKNGNLLLNVGPMADGRISELQLERLEGLGQWLQINQEAIFDSMPWLIADSITQDGIDIRFTQKNDVLYAILMDIPRGNTITFPNLHADQDMKVCLLGQDIPLTWHQREGGVTIEFPTAPLGKNAYTLKLSPIPTLLQKV